MNKQRITVHAYKRLVNASYVGFHTGGCNCQMCLHINATISLGLGGLSRALQTHMRPRQQDAVVDGRTACGPCERRAEWSRAQFVYHICLQASLLITAATYNTENPVPVLF